MNDSFVSIPSLNPFLKFLAKDVVQKFGKEAAVKIWEAVPRITMAPEAKFAQVNWDKIEAALKHEQRPRKRTVKEPAH